VTNSWRHFSTHAPSSHPNALSFGINWLRCIPRSAYE
jgi:hypothetical protein